MPPRSEILETARWNITQAARRLDLTDNQLARLREPKERIEVTCHPAMISSNPAHVKAFIVRHNDTLGPSKGGIRMTPDVTLDEVTGLAMEMTWKTALIGVPFGGGKSGLACDPKTVSPDEKEIIIRSFTRGVSRQIGPEIYIPAPDMGTSEREMGFIRDCISYSHGEAITRGCFVTGKPVILGGIVGRKQATGQGVVYAIQAACEKRQIDLSNATVAVQGFGNVASVAAVEIAALGARVVAAADLSGGAWDPAGLDVMALHEHVLANGHIAGFTAKDTVGPQEVLEVECDILIPAAAGSVITQQNAGNIKAKIIAEGANAPTTPQADEILDDRDIFIIPDILANAGGVFVSYLEYTQETQREQMTLEVVHQRLAKRMADRFGAVYELAAGNALSMRAAAMDLAVTRVMEGVQARGLLP